MITPYDIRQELNKRANRKANTEIAKLELLSDEELEEKLSELERK